LAAVQLLSKPGFTAVSFLLYGIVHSDRAEPRENVEFNGYPRARIIARTGRLGGIVSRLSPADADPDVARLLVYSKIVETFNHERAVIPMRYGCRFKTIVEIVGFLKRKESMFVALLDELDGRVEMSASMDCEEASIVSATPLSRLSSRANTAGIDYLAARRRHYSLVDQSGMQREEVRQSLCALAEGKFIRAIPEQSSHDRKSMLTVHFLVQREGVAEFTRALRVDRRRTIELSGPWPPYNFVSPKIRAPTI
jgi:hypothetical protein